MKKRMTKFAKQYYYSAKGDKKVNCYKVTISKDMLFASGLNEDDEIEVITKAGSKEIIIRKA